MSTNIKYLFFDFETSGIGNFKKQKAIQLAWVIADHNFNKMSEPFSFYFNDITRINTEFHKNLTVNKIKKIGVEPNYILNHFLKDCLEIIKCKGLIIAHNVDFDFQILKNECEKQNIIFPFDIMQSHLLCTMKATTKLCKLKSHNGFNKYPRLIELYQFLHNNIPELQLHEASNDVEVLYRCFSTLSTKYNYIHPHYLSI
jgi:DNA polymerase III alpha subunit (gram-positive type)